MPLHVLPHARALYPPRKPQEAFDYSTGLRLGQTEAGSFVLNIHSPVPPRWQMELFEDLPALWEEPFERRALLTLTEALTAMQQAVTSVGASGNFQPFLDAVPSGVSANLCAALSELSMHNMAAEVSLQIRWSPARLAADTTPTQFCFRRDAFALLYEASRVLRDAASIEDFALFGAVTELCWKEEADQGQVTVSGWVENTWRKVRMELSGQDYGKAVKAYVEREMVRCIGELMKEKRTYLLRNVRLFKQMEYPAEDMPDEEDPFSDNYNG